MEQSHHDVVLYTLPVCPNCQTLKQALMRYSIAFDEEDLDSPQARTTLLMQGVFTTTAPVLKVKNTFLTYEELFENDALRIDLVLELLQC
ncbi:MAG: glutaredoxin family protein [Halobacteriota archaeon]